MVVPEPPRSGTWRIPGWYWRVGLSSALFLAIVAAVALLVALVSITSELTAPLILGAFLAVAFSPVVEWLAERGLNRGLAALVVLIGLLIVVVGVIWITAVALVDQADELSATLDKAMEDIRSWLDNTPVNEELVDQVRAATGDVGPALADGLVGRLVSIVDSAFGLVTGIILGTIVLYYLLKDGAQLAARRLEAEDDEARRELLGRLSERTVSDVRAYFRGRTAIALVNGLVIGVAVALLGVPAAGAIGVVNFFGAYIPYLGAFVGGAFAVLMALGEGGLGLALGVLAISLAMNLLLENLLEPALIGDSLDLHPLLVLLATTLGGMVAGMIGLVLAAPTLAIAIDVGRELRAAGFFDDEQALEAAED